MRAEDVQVDRFGFGRGIDTELVGQEASASLVRPQRLSPVPGAGVCPHRRSLDRLTCANAGRSGEAKVLAAPRQSSRAGIPLVPRICEISPP